MVCKFCRFRTDDSKTVCPKCGATLIEDKVVEVKETNEVVEEINEPTQSSEPIENFTKEFQNQFNNAKNRAVKFITLIVVAVIIFFLIKACGK